MFNRVAQRDVVTFHNILGIMSRSRKRPPIFCWTCCKSQKRGKEVCNRKFRRRERQKISTGDLDKLPRLTIEVMDTWDLGGDGNGYYHATPNDDYLVKLMRK